MAVATSSHSMCDTISSRNESYRVPMLRNYLEPDASMLWAGDENLRIQIKNFAIEESRHMVPIFGISMAVSTNRSQRSKLVQANFKQVLEFIVSMGYLTVLLPADTLSRSCIRLSQANLTMQL